MEAFVKKAFILAILLVVIIVSSAKAAEQIDVEKIMFKRLLKEYACKLIYPSLRHEKPELAKYDLSNLKMKIIIDLSQNSKNYGYLKEFINENPDFTEGIDYLIKILHEKQKFEYLQNNKLDFYKAEELINYNASTVKRSILGLGEWITFKYSFNLPPDKYSFINKVYKTTKDINEEYGLILFDYRNITDKETLLKLGPSIIERSEKLLTGKDDGLNDSNAQDLFVMAGNCRVGLDLDLTTTPREVVARHYVDYIKKVYVNISIPKYKFCSLYAVAQMLESVQKYEELLAYELNLKKDILDKIDVLYNLRIVVLICKIIIEKCPVKQEYFEIGKENCSQLLIFADQLDIITSDQKDILKQVYRFGYHTELYAKYKYYNEAVNQLDIVIASPFPPPTTDSGWIDIYNDIHTRSVTRREQIVPMIDIKLEFVDSGSVKQVFDHYKKQDENICNFTIKLTSKTGDIIPQSFSIILSYDDQVDKDFVDVQKFFEKHRIDSLRGTDHGFMNGGKSFKTLTLNEINQNIINFSFKYSCFSGDLFKITAKAASPFKSECNTQIQVWKQFTLNLYGMRDSSGKILYPNVKFAIGRFKDCFVDFIVKNNSEVVIPYHKDIFAGIPEELPVGSFWIMDFIKETKNEIKYNEQFEFLNVVGCYNVTVKDTVFNSNDSGYGFYFRHFSTQFKPLIFNQFFNTALIAYSKFKDEEGKTITHEIGHSFGLQHPFDPQNPNSQITLKYDHAENCIMQGGPGFPEATFCPNCVLAIRNSNVNSVEMEVGPQKRKKSNK